MAGLLDDISEFIKTPAGQGLLSAGFGGLATAQRGAPLNSLGRAGIAGLQGFGSAIDRQDRNSQEAQIAKMRDLQMQQQQLQLDSSKIEADKAAKLRSLVGQFTTPAKPASPGGLPLEMTSSLPAEFQTGVQIPKMPEQPASFNREGFAKAWEALDPVDGFRYQQSIQRDDAPVKLAPGESLYSGKASGYKPILSVPKEFNKPAEQQGYELAKSQGFNGTYLEYQLALKKAGAASTTVNMTDGQKGFENEMKLGAAFKQEPIYKDHAAVQSAFSQINAALAQGSPISDTAAATKIMKILDPGSVVRESELGMAMAAGGRMDRLQNYLKQAMDGTKLTPQQRTDFGNLASELTAASAHAYNSKRSEFHQQGKDYGLDADRALGKAVAVPAATKQVATEGLSIAAPNGKTYTFKSEREMANFKMATGVK